MEEKYTYKSDNSTYDRTGTVVYVSGTAQGDGTTDREGNSIKIQHFRLRLFIKHNAATTGGTCHRIMVVRDLQNQGATIVANDVLEDVSGSGAPLSHRDFTNGPLQNKRFAVVYDKTFVTDPYNLIKHDVFETAHDCHVYYRGTTNAVASAGNGSYFLIAVSSDTGANLPTVFYETRHEFTDN